MEISTSIYFHVWLLIFLVFASQVMGRVIEEDTSVDIQTNISGLILWTNLFADCANKQSSVSITDRRTADSKGSGDNIVESFNEPFVFVNYDFIPANGGIYNNGHSVLMQPRLTSHAKPIVRGGGLTEDYELHHLHFHYGQDSDLGIDHVINDEPLPLELHFVHFKTQYGSMEEAVKHGDGLSIIVVPFRISILDNEVFSPIVKFLYGIKHPGENKFYYSHHSLLEFLPDDRNSYYRYSGPLAYPSCLNIATWTVFTETVPISSRQLDSFRTVFDNSGKPPTFGSLKPIINPSVLNAFYLNRPQKKYILSCQVPILCPLLSRVIGSSFSGISAGDSTGHSSQNNGLEGKL